MIHYIKAYREQSQHEQELLRQTKEKDAEETRKKSLANLKYMAEQMNLGDPFKTDPELPIWTWVYEYDDVDITIRIEGDSDAATVVGMVSMDMPTFKEVKQTSFHHYVLPKMNSDPESILKKSLDLFYRNLAVFVDEVRGKATQKWKHYQAIAHAIELYQEGDRVLTEAGLREHVYNVYKQKGTTNDILSIIGK